MRPETITLDGYAASHRAVRELKADGLLPADTKLRSSKYLNNLIEQDHRGVKQRIAVMLGFKDFANRGDHDRRHRTDAPHPQGTVRTGTSGCSRSTCACSARMPCSSLKSPQSNTGRFPQPVICTRAGWLSRPPRLPPEPCGAGPQLSVYFRNKSSPRPIISPTDLGLELTDWRGYYACIAL